MPTESIVDRGRRLRDPTSQTDAGGVATPQLLRIHHPMLPAPGQRIRPILQPQPRPIRPGAYQTVSVVSGSGEESILGDLHPGDRSATVLVRQDSRPHFHGRPDPLSKTAQADPNCAEPGR